MLDKRQDGGHGGPGSESFGNQEIPPFGEHSPDLPF